MTIFFNQFEFRFISSSFVSFTISLFFFFYRYRYYRLWIYTCNAVLLMAVIIFCCIAGKVLLADYRRLLINGLNLGQPSFVYAYLALLVQSGEFNGNSDRKFTNLKCQTFLYCTLHNVITWRKSKNMIQLTFLSAVDTL